MNRKVAYSVPNSARQLRKRRDHCLECLHRIGRALGAATDPRIDDAYRRAEQGPSGDGYPRSSIPGGGRSIGGHGDPTGNLVTAHAGGHEATRERPATPDAWQGRRETDVVGQQVAQAARLTGLLGWALDTADQAAKDLELLFVALAHTSDLARDRVRVPSWCKCCSREVAATTADPLVAGMCRPCNSSWVHAGRPIEEAFHAWRKARLERLDEREAG